MVEQQPEEVTKITDFSRILPMEDMYLPLEDNIGSKAELGVYCNRYVERDLTKKLAIILTGFTCAGKDTVMDELESLGLVYHVVTATSRPRRIEEPEDKYHWITVREKGEKETNEEYEESIKKDHDLVECDCHYKHVYGLPRNSLLVEGRGIPVIRPDINGTNTLHKELPKYGFQPISIAVVADSWEQIYRTLLEEREETLGDKNSRFIVDINSVSKYSNVVNYFLHNSRDVYGDMSGLERSVRGMRYIIEMYTKK
ncbi:MAG: hypothetical protein PHE21_00270 [Candidatus Dojkabacteria bacterium]|nr:hypothetical protein [Candidatus Dojkabacteria bacterium]